MARYSLFVLKVPLNTKRPTIAEPVTQSRCIVLHLVVVICKLYWVYHGEHGTVWKMKVFGFAYHATLFWPIPV